MTPPPSLRPLGAAEAVDAAIQLARRHYGALAMTALVPLLPYFAMDAWTSAPDRRPGFWPMLIFTAICSSLAGAATARAAYDAYVAGEGASCDPARALRAVAARAWPVLATGVVRTVLATLGLGLLIAPGLWVIATFALVPALAVLEPGADATATLRRSASLTAGNRWRMVGAYVLPSTGAFVANMIASSLVQRVVAAGGSPTSTAHMVGGFAGSTVAILLTPVTACLQVVLYLDCRVRKEALDLEWALAANAGADTASVAPGR